MLDPSSPIPVSGPLQLSLLTAQSQPRTSTSLHSPLVSTDVATQHHDSTTRALPPFVLPENATRLITSLSPLPSLQSKQDTFSSTVYNTSNLVSDSTQNPPLNIPATLHTRIDSLQKALAQSQFLPSLLEHFSAQSPVAFVSLDLMGKLRIPGRRHRDDLIHIYGYPKTDDDVDYCLEDVPGLSADNFQILRSSLVSHLFNVRRAAFQTVAQVEDMLIQQMQFRLLPIEELNRLFQCVVERFCKARRLILYKYRAYVRSVRWIENMSTRQRRGCLTHRQNNVLRTWLFQNFDNPYPSNGDKKKLMQEAQLSATQVNNWLINARSRVWKPTIDIMSREWVQREMMKMEQWCATMKEEVVSRDEGNGSSVTSQNDTHDSDLKLTSKRGRVHKALKSRRGRKTRAASSNKGKENVNRLGQHPSHEELDF